MKKSFKKLRKKSTLQVTGRAPSIDEVPDSLEILRLLGMERESQILRNMALKMMGLDEGLRRIVPRKESSRVKLRLNDR